MTDRRAASLSASLIVRKGAASARGFAETPLDVARQAPVRSSPPRTGWLPRFGLGVVLLTGFLTLVWLVFATGDGGGRDAVIGDVAAVAGPATVEPVSTGAEAVGGREPPVMGEGQPRAGTPGLPVGALETMAPEAPTASAGPDLIDAAALPPGSGPRPVARPLPSSPAGAEDRAAGPATAPIVEVAAPGKARRERPGETAGGAGGGGYRVQLHALGSDAAVRRAWPRLQKTHGDLLGGLSLKVVRSGSGPRQKSFYRMQVGTLASAAAAKKLCDRLKRRKLDCVIVRP